MKNKIKKLLSIIFLTIFIISIAYIISYIYTSNQYEKDIKEIQRLMNISENDKEGVIFEASNEENTNTIDSNSENNVDTDIENFNEVQKINSDIVAWIIIDGTNINYPILQSDNNDYYLYKDYRKQYSRYGSLFLDYRYDFEKENQNFLVYGHNNNDKMMFNDLLKYEDGKFFDENRNIMLITNNEKSKYKIHFAFKSKVYNETDTNVFRYYNYIDLSDENKFAEYINGVSKASIHSVKFDIEYGKEILTLSTCEYSEPNGRFVVVAIKE